ncbi:LysR family transcriptional regulator [Reinekea marina]|uniref:LysR family transcriptional regulator n=1 Tax=Reinekea marina TaxID=1310421 RepID=A0ABV7WS87_9GAMM|nr:LysR family transcriptional regulator [Reinekea marina]MDN3647856.1 LysR family transcriptional regulator [Reinekea marina]
MQKSKELNFDWEDLRYVYHVAKEGSIAAAARKLGVNHSTVFRRLNQFEKRCGTNLFIRNNNGYELSPTGLEILSYLDKTEENIQAISLKLMGKEQNLEGNIRITVPGARIETQVVDWIVGFQAIHPNVHFSIDSSLRHADLNRREADIAIRATMTPPEHLVGSELSRMNWGVVANPDLLERFGVPDTFEEALQLPWIGYNGSKPSILAELYKRYLPNRTFAIEVDNLEAVRYAARKGLGLGLLPFDDGGENLVTLRFPEIQFESGLWILTHPDLIHAARISAFMQYVREQMR